MIYLLSVICYLLSVICICAPAGASPAEARLSLADSLHESGDFAQAALEYRRLAADLEPADPSLPGLFLAAADAYRQGGDAVRLERMLTHFDDVGTNSDSVAVWLHMRLDETRGHWASAMLYAETLRNIATMDDNADLLRHATGALAANALRAESLADARAATAGDPVREAALERYLAGRDKSPTVGGLLGIVPGLGYAYSGEWGNMFRSLFLNGLFGWAMFECADREQWGLFAVTTFFELTWYTGSIYGGIDAAHRYNRRRLDDADRELRGDEAPALRPGGRVDLFSLHLDF
jgi:hypothetical protein